MGHLPQDSQTRYRHSEPVRAQRGTPAPSVPVPSSRMPAICSRPNPQRVLSIKSYFFPGYSRVGGSCTPTAAPAAPSAQSAAALPPTTAAASVDSPSAVYFGTCPDFKLFVKKCRSKAHGRLKVRGHHWRQCVSAISHTPSFRFSEP